MAQASGRTLARGDRRRHAGDTKAGFAALSAEGLLFDGPELGDPTVILAHGAGAPMDSLFLARVARELGSGGARVVRFEFPYMAARRSGGGRKAPDREPVLRRTWLEVISRFRGGSDLVIGGKSMGGRIASLVADEAGVSGLLCLGYPFHPPGQPQRRRTAHLEHLRTPALIVQGTRDAFGTREEVLEYPLAPSVRIHWIEQGDHSWKPPARSGRTQAQSLEEAIQAIRDFLANPEVIRSRRSGRGERN